MNWIENQTWSRIFTLPNNDHYYGPELPTRLTLINDQVAKTLKVLDFGAGKGRNLGYYQRVFNEVHQYDLPEFGYKNLVDICAQKYDLINACFTFQFMDSLAITECIKFLSKICDTFYLTTRSYCNDRQNVLKLFIEAGYKCVAATQNIELFQTLNDETCGEFILTKSFFPLNYSAAHYGSDFIYLSYQDVFNDVREWCKTLDIGAVCGVPRSGLVIAQMISSIKHIPLYPIEIFTNDCCYWRPDSSRQLVLEPHKPIFIVDDTSWSGTAMFLLKKKLRRTVTNAIGMYKFGALYVSGNTDLEHFKILNTVHHTFDWNFLRDINVGHYCLDFDGVLCEDFNGGDSEGDDYMEHLRNAKPLYKPIYPVKKIVSARLEKYRAETEEWLERHGIKYGELCLLNVTRHELRTPENAVRHKTDNYDSDSLLFVESCPIQAAKIHEMTGRRVFSTDDWRLHGK
jgi:hypothetical protein